MLFLIDEANKTVEFVAETVEDEKKLAVFKKMTEKNRNLLRCGGVYATIPATEERLSSTVIRVIE